MTEQIIKTLDQDSLELGSAKFGKIKVYGDFNKKTEFKKKVDVALEIREYAIQKPSV